MMNDQINSEKLRTAIATGCDEYLTIRSNDWCLDRWWYGEEGIVRASNAKLCVANISSGNMNKDLHSLALWGAILNTNTQRLALLIAAHLFSGEQEIHGTYVNDFIDKPRVKGRVTSTVFPQATVSLAIEDRSNFTEEYNTQAGPVLVTDKVRCAKWIMRNQTFFADKDALNQTIDGYTNDLAKPRQSSHEDESNTPLMAWV